MLEDKHTQSPEFELIGEFPIERGFIEYFYCEQLEYFFELFKGELGLFPECYDTNNTDVVQRNFTWNWVIRNIIYTIKIEVSGKDEFPDEVSN